MWAVNNSVQSDVRTKLRSPTILFPLHTKIATAILSCPQHCHCFTWPSSFRWENSWRWNESTDEFWAVLQRRRTRRWSWMRSSRWSWRARRARRREASSSTWRWSRCPPRPSASTTSSGSRDTGDTFKAHSHRPLIGVRPELGRQITIGIWTNSSSWPVWMGLHVSSTLLFEILNIECTSHTHALTQTHTHTHTSRHGIRGTPTPWMHICANALARDILFILAIDTACWLGMQLAPAFSLFVCCSSWDLFVFYCGCWSLLRKLHHASQMQAAIAWCGCLWRHWTIPLGEKAIHLLCKLLDGNGYKNTNNTEPAFAQVVKTSHQKHGHNFCAENCCGCDILFHNRKETENTTQDRSWAELWETVHV